MSNPKPLVEVLTKLLEPYDGIPTSADQEVLHEAAKRAGWRLPSPKAEVRQRAAARGRKTQQHHDLAHRRLLVASFFKELSPGRQAQPSSLATAQAIIGKIEKLPWDKVRKPPMTVRTIQADIKFLRNNGGFGI